MADSPFPSKQNPQIQQDINGNSNQTIGQVVGGMVVYGQVICNNAIAEPDASISKREKDKIGPNPYKGLLAFHETDGDRFFGRDKEIQELWEQFRQLHEDESKTRLLTIYGPSGSGKSSLARAGLIPELARGPLPGSDRARVAVLVPGSHPVEALATILARIATQDPIPVSKTREFVTELKQANDDGHYDGLRRIADALPEIERSPLIVLVDQLEEVFTLCEDADEQKAFIGNLLVAGGDRARRVSVILTLRSDFLGSTHQYSQLNQLIANQGFLVAAMTSEGLREAITKPAKLVGHSLDQSTVSRLIEQTEGREGALPLLQFALTRIWAGLAEGREPAETLETIGGVGGALAGEAQRIYDSLRSEEQAIARRLFLGLVQLGEGAKDTRRRTELARVVAHCDNLEQVRKVIARFSDPGARLITLASESGTETAEVTHEALFEHWQQLKDWLDRSRDDLRFQRRLDEAAIIWQENGRPDGSLWRSPDLDLLQSYHERSSDDMTTVQVKFVRASISSAVARRRKEQERIQVENDLVKQKLKASEDRSKARRRITLAMSIGLVLTSTATIFALSQVQQAQRRRVEQIAANAQILLSSDPVEAALNAIAAVGLSQSTWIQFPDDPKFLGVVGSLLDVVRENHERNILVHDDSVFSINTISFSPDNKVIVTGCGDGTLRLWNAITGQPIGEPLKGHKKFVTSVAFRFDGKRIVSGGGDGTVRLWDAITGQPVGRFLWEHNGVVTTVAFSSDGKRIFSGNQDGMLRSWDAITGQPIGKPFKANVDNLRVVAFSPNGERIATGSADGTLQLWDSVSERPINNPTRGHEAIITSLAFSPNGRHFVSGDYDGTLRVWNASTGQPHGKPLFGHDGEVTSLAFNSNGKQFVSGGEDRIMRLWNAVFVEPVGKPFKGHDGKVTSVKFSPNGKHLISSGGDHVVRVWELDSGQSINQAFKSHHASVFSVAYSPNGKRIVSGGVDGLRLWDAVSGLPINKPFKGYDTTVYSVAFSPSGRRIVSGSGEGQIRLWDAVSGLPINKPFKKYDTTVYSVAFSPSGRRIVSGGVKGIQLWDADSGQLVKKPFMKEERYVYSVAFSPDGKRIISGGASGRLQLWDVTSGLSIGKPFEGHKTSISSVAFSPDGKRIVSGGSNDANSILFNHTSSEVRLWDATLGLPISKPLRGHESGVRSVAFSPTGKLVVSAGGSKVKLWDVVSGSPISKPLEENISHVTSVAFSPDGTSVVVGDSSGKVHLWQIGREYLLQLACSQMRYHPKLINPATDVAKDAKRTCVKYAWKV